MQLDNRTAQEIAEEFTGKKLESKLNALELKAYLNAFIHVILARSSLDDQFTLKL